jgi:hypothetical protein
MFVSKSREEVTETNTLAYNIAALLTMVKCFVMKVPPRPYTIKLYRTVIVAVL